MNRNDTSLTPSRPNVGGFIGLAFFAFVGLTLGQYFYSAYQVKHAVETGTPTVAQVERTAPGNCLVGESRKECLALTVKLYPASGAPYSSSFTQLIPDKWLSRVQPGSWLTVAVDPKNPQKVTFDERTMYVAPPAPPASALEAP